MTEMEIEFLKNSPYFCPFCNHQLRTTPKNKTKTSNSGKRYEKLCYCSHCGKWIPKRKALKRKNLNILDYMKKVLKDSPDKNIVVVGKIGSGKSYFAWKLGKLLRKRVYTCEDLDEARRREPVFIIFKSFQIVEEGVVYLNTEKRLVKLGKIKIPSNELLKFLKLQSRRLKHEWNPFLPPSEHS